MLPVAIYARTDVGKEHHTNEDSFAVRHLSPSDALLLVCDGMGGMGRGDEASSLGVDVITAHAAKAEEDGPIDRMATAIQLADRAIRAALCSGIRGRPGCTVASLFIRGNQGFVSWVGDSRVYLVRDGAVVQRTRDHKIIEDLIEAGELTRAEAKTSGLSSMLSRALGGRPPGGEPLEVASLPTPWDLQPGDWLVLCSDGLADLVPDEELPSYFEDSDPAAASQALIQIALDRGGHDNITVICANWLPEGAAIPATEQLRSNPTELAEDLLARADAAVNGPNPDASTEPFAPERKDWPEPDSDARIDHPTRPRAAVIQRRPKSTPKATMLLAVMLAFALAIFTFSAVHYTRLVTTHATAASNR